MEPCTEFNLASRAQWLKDWKSHQTRLQVIMDTPSPRVDHSRPEYFTPAFHHTQGKLFRRHGTGYSEAERQVIAQNQKISLRLVHAISQPSHAETGLLHRTKPNQIQKIMREQEITEENLRLVEKLSAIQPSISAKNLNTDFRLSRTFQELRRKPPLSVNLPPVKSNLRVSIGPGTSRGGVPTAPSSHSSHILLPSYTSRDLDPLHATESGT